MNIENVSPEVFSRIRWIPRYLWCIYKVGNGNYMFSSCLQIQLKEVKLKHTSKWWNHKNAKKKIIVGFILNINFVSMLGIHPKAFQTPHCFLLTQKQNCVHINLTSNCFYLSSIHILKSFIVKTLFCENDPIVLL
jgi:hypothetical protein